MYYKSGLCFFVFIFIFYGYAFSYNTEKKFDSIFDLTEKKQYSDIFFGRKNVQILYDIANSKNGSSEMKAKAIYSDLSVQYAAGILDKNAYNIIRKALDSNDTTIYNTSSGFIYLALSKYMILSGNYTDALNNGLAALEIFTNLNEYYFIADANNIIGNIFRFVQEYELSSSYYKEALKYYYSKNNIYKSLLTEMNLSVAEFMAGLKNDALKRAEKLIKKAEMYKDTAMLTIAYINAGTFHIRLNKNEKSQEYYLKALNLSKYLKNDNVYLSIILNIGVFNLRNKNADSAYYSFKKVERAIINGNTNIEKLINAYQGLSESFFMNKRFDSAYFYLRAYDSVKDLLIGTERIASIHHINTREIHTDYNNKLTTAKNEIMLKENRNLIILLSSTGIILIMSLVIVIIVLQRNAGKQREKMKELEYRKLCDKLSNEEKISKLQKEKFKTKIDSQNREISSSLLLLSSKNELLKKIMNLSDNLGDNNFTTGYKENIKSIISDSLRIDNEWNFFKLHFEKVHPDFFLKLKNICDKLSENELKLCAYIRIGMRIKQIAQMSSVSPGSIKINRYRLKKKFGIDEDFSLDDFIRNI